MNDLSARIQLPGDLVPLAQDHAYVRQNPAPSFWALMPHQLHQYTDSSCSLASAVMVLNAARGLEGANIIGGLVSERRLRELFKDTPLAGCIAADGGGLTMPELTDYLTRAIAHYGLHGWHVDVRPVAAATKAAAETLQADLAAMEAAPCTFLIANYHLDQLYGDGSDIGHFSPLGAYDAARDRVLILDVYKADYEPAWTPVDRLLAAMARHRNNGDLRGYLVVRKG